MPYTVLLYEIRPPGVAVITLNRPAVFNAFDLTLSRELLAALAAAGADEAVRVVVLTGAGRAFCAGQDLQEAQQPGTFSFKEVLETRYNPIIRAMRALPKPIIGRLNGVAAGAGCSLALACDALVASRTASLVQAFINIGLVPDSGSAYFLPRLVGRLKAFEICALGDKISADEALRLGLVSVVVEPEQLDAATDALAARYAAGPPRSLGILKQLLEEAATANLSETLALEADAQEQAGSGAEYQEGLRAFLEKRKPKYG